MELRGNCIFCLSVCRLSWNSSDVIPDLLWSVLGVCRLVIYTLQCYLTQVSNRRSRRWLNDRLLIELVPRLHVEEIKGLFAPPPWGMLQNAARVFFFLRKNAAFSWMSLLLFNIWVFVLTGLGCYMPTCMHLCWQSYATYLHLCIYRSYVSKCSCGVALLLVIGITCMIFSCVCLWKSSTLYYIDYVGEELPLSAFCRTSVSEWEAFRSIDMDAEVCTCPASSVLFIIVHKII